MLRHIKGLLGLSIVFCIGVIFSGPTQHWPRPERHLYTETVMDKSGATVAGAAVHLFKRGSRAGSGR